MFSSHMFSANTGLFRVVLLFVSVFLSVYRTCAVLWLKKNLFIL